MVDTDDTPESRAAEDSEIHWFAKRIGIAIGMVAAAVLVAALLIETVTVFFLLFAAILWAVLLRGISNYVAEYTPIPVRLALALVLLTLGGLVVALGFLSGPNMVEQANRAAEVVPRAVDEARNWLANSPLGGQLGGVSNFKPEDVAKSEIWKRALGVFAGALGLAGNSLLIFVTGIYLAIQPERYERGLVRLSPLGYRERTADLIDKTGTQLGWWIAGRLLSMAIVAILTTVVLALMGIPLALLLGILSGLLAFVPVVGPIAAAIPAMLVGLLKGPQFVLYIAILYFSVQAIENYVIMPIVGEKVVEIPPALLLMAQVLIGLLTGLFGLILATPLLVMIMVLVEHAYIHDALGEPEDAEAPA